MVLVGFKRPPSFKVTPKSKAPGPPASAAAKGSSKSAGQGVPLELASNPSSEGKSPVDTGKEPSKGGSGGGGGYQRQYRLHGKLSSVTNKRRLVMPMDGTLDIWVLAGITAINLFAAGWGLVRLQREGAFSAFGGGSENVLWLGVVFAFVDAVPGLLLMGYMALYQRAPALLRAWVPLVGLLSAAAAIAIEGRLSYGYGREIYFVLRDKFATLG